MPQEYPPGHYALAIRPQRVRDAIDDLFGHLDTPRLRKLKIRSGEHIAAVLTTAFLGVAPTEVDLDGGADLEFDVANQSSSEFLRTSVFTSTSVAFEIKSPDNGYRQFEGAINDDLRSGKPVRNPVRAVKITTAQSVMTAATKLIERARDQLIRKTDATTSKNVFIVVHPLDHMAIEHVEEVGFLGPSLTPVNYPELDSLWVLWGADYLTVWSTRRGEWINFFFNAAFSPEEAAESSGEFVLLQEVEGEFLMRLGLTHGSPYLFTFAEPPTE